VQVLLLRTEEGAALRMHRALVRIYRALEYIYRALLRSCRR